MNFSENFQKNEKQRNYFHFPSSNKNQYSIFERSVCIMKKWARGLVVCAAAAVLSIGAACMAYAAEGEINVNGTGVVRADPDTADISLEISTDGKAAQAAQKENNRITAAVTKAMTDLNVKKDDIVTAYTSVYPTYRYNDETGKRTITGYHAETHLQVKTKDINNTGKYIDAALQAGATGTNGVSFSIADQSKYYGQALQAAVKNAEKSAAAIAQAYGKPLGTVKNVSEISRNYYYMNTDSNAKSSMMATEDAVADGGLGTTISYGKIEITANISVTYGF